MADQSSAGSALNYPWACWLASYGASLLLLSQIGLCFKTSGTVNIPCGCSLDWHRSWGNTVVWPAQAIKQLLHMGWFRVAHSWGCGPGWTSSPLHWELQKTSTGGLYSDKSLSDPYSWTLLEGAEWCMGCSCYWDPLGGWPTWVALLVWELDWPLYLGMAWLPVFWLCVVEAYTAAAAELVFLLAYCCSLYFCCGLWVQDSTLLTKGTLQKTSSCRL